MENQQQERGKKQINTVNPIERDIIQEMREFKNYGVFKMV